MDVVLGYGPRVDVENMLERAEGLLVRHSARAKGIVVVLGPLHGLVTLDLDLPCLLEDPLGPGDGFLPRSLHALLRLGRLLLLLLCARGSRRTLLRASPLVLLLELRQRRPLLLVGRFKSLRRRTACSEGG